MLSAFFSSQFPLTYFSRIFSSHFYFSFVRFFTFFFHIFFSFHMLLFTCLYFTFLFHFFFFDFFSHFFQRVFFRGIFSAHRATSTVFSSKHSARARLAIFTYRLTWPDRKRDAGEVNSSKRKISRWLASNLDKAMYESHEQQAIHSNTRVNSLPRDGSGGEKSLLLD